MIVSTRGRYALRVMIDLAERNPDTFTPLKEMAHKQGISQKYMEGIMATLSKGDLVKGLHGKGGGYRLCRAPEEYKVSEILSLTEKESSPVGCNGLTNNCENSDICRIYPLWEGLNKVIMDYLSSYTLKDLMEQNITI